MMTNYFSHCWGVFEGGGVRAAAHAGAYAAARDAGVVFGRMAGTSAGSIVAAFAAAGGSPSYISKLLQDTDISKFLGPAQPRDTVFTTRPWWLKVVKALTFGNPNWVACIAMDSGQYSSIPLQDWLEKHLLELVGPRRAATQKGAVRFAEMQLPLHVVATDLTTGQPKIWSCETTPDDSVAVAVRCSCSIPFFYQAVSHQQSILVDGGVVSNLPAFVFNELVPSEYRSVLSRIVAFRLIEDPENRGNIVNLLDFATRLSNAAIDGGAHIQLGLQSHVYQILIPTGTIRSTDFAKVGEKEKKELHQAGSEAVRKFIAQERGIIRDINPTLGYKGFDEKMLFLVQELQNCERRFIAVGKSTYWLDFAFPAFLALARRGVQIVVVTSKPIGVDEQRRHWLLGELGAKLVYPEEALPFDGFAFDLNGEKASALLSSWDENQINESRYVNESVCFYTKHRDPAIIEMLKEKTEDYWSKFCQEPRTLPYEPCADLELFKRLRTVSHYENAKFNIVEVDVCDDILVLQKSIKEFKFLQIRQHFYDLEKHGCDLFAPLEVMLPGGRGTIVTPPVLERLDNKLVVIDGNTRLFHCLATGIHSVKAVIVDKVTTRLPAQNPQPLSSLKLVSSTTQMDAMYTNVNKSLFRNIEEAVHAYP